MPDENLAKNYTKSGVAINKGSVIPLLKCKDISFAYQQELVLNGVNLEISRGDFCAIIGPNGGGKSTLGKIIVGLLDAGKGRILYEGSERAKAGFIGYVPQDTSLNKDFPIRAIDVVLMGFLSKGKNRIGNEHKKRALELLESLNMGEFAYRSIGDLSGGQRQRVLIARALADEPSLLLFDEPTASIDSRMQREIYTFLKNLSINRGVIVISHDVSLLLGYATKALYVNRDAVEHTLEDIRCALPSDGHLCEVEFLQAFEQHKGCK